MRLLPADRWAWPIETQESACSISIPRLSCWPHREENNGLLYFCIWFLFIYIYFWNAFLLCCPNWFQIYNPSILSSFIFIAKSPLYPLQSSSSALIGMCEYNKIISTSTNLDIFFNSPRLVSYNIRNQPKIISHNIMNISFYS